MQSRETSDAFMPWCPMAIPSVTVMVLNRRGIPPASLTPIRAASACASSVVLHGAESFPAEAIPTNGRPISSSVSPMA